MRLQPICDGAYNEAAETSGERIMLVMFKENRRDNIRGGYSSDAGASGGQETDNCSIADAPSSISCSCASSSSSSGGETSVESEIEFLQEKERLLKRAVSAMKSIGAYDASNAHAVLNEIFPSESPLWNEAKEFLEILNLDGSEAGRATTSTSRVRVDRPRDTKRPRIDISSVVCLSSSNVKIDRPRHTKRPRIDISSVVCLSSGNFGDVILPSSACKRAIPAMPFACTGPWMAKAMAHSIPSLAKQHDSMSTASPASWEVVNDPDLGLLVLPPSKVPFHDGIQLKDALGFTSVAQLITLSTPPFCVVHANKAFSMFSGLSNGVVIGEPVESILQVVQDIPTEPSRTTQKSSRSLGSLIVSPNKPCQLLVIPITDRFGNPQGGMSHLLVKIEPSEGQGTTVDGTRAKTPGKGLGVRENRHGFGTVG